MIAPALTSLRLAVVGAGPVGLAVALQAARLLPHAQITVFDARPADRDVSADPRTLALSWGSVQFLRQLQAWPAADAAGRLLVQPILQVHVSQAPPTLQLPGGDAQLLLRAQDLGVPMLGAVAAYGRVLAPLQQAWQALAAQAPQRLRTRFGTPVQALKPVALGVELDAGIAELFDLVVVAEGGVFGQASAGADASSDTGKPEAPRKLLADYGQTAWVGSVSLQGGLSGTAFERFTRQGPAALLPLPPDPAAGDGADKHRAALVWCVPSADDPVAGLDDMQRLAVLRHVFPAAAGQLCAISPLKPFALGLDAQRSLVQGRMVRIGNAAQTLHPVAGQGLNLGLRDAHELVQLLRSSPDVDTALQRVRWARGADRWSTIAATDFLARSFTWQLPGAATARGLGLAALQAAPPLQRWLARRMMFGLR